MLSKPLDELPAGEEWLYEPKWDGFRALVFVGREHVFTQSRDLKPLDRYFPELHEAFLRELPPGCVVDGEIVIATPAGLDFDALQLRLHPAASRVATLAAQTPAAFVAFDVLAADWQDVRAAPQRERRGLLERLLGREHHAVHLTPLTDDRALALEWLSRFEGAGLDGVIAKQVAGTYQPGKRTMGKVKHVRTADCVAAGFRWYKDSRDEVGSLLLGVYDANGSLQHIGVASSFSGEARKRLLGELAPLRSDALEGHPWRDWADADEFARMPGAQSRWSAGKDLSWEPLRIERVCEVKYDHLQGRRFRHATTLVRWRPDRRPSSCRYDQFAVTPPFELERVFAAGAAETPPPPARDSGRRTDAT
jgi:ATP-dependent DNA ligase